MKIHFTSTAFHNADWREKLKRCRNCADSFGWDFGVQLHNTAPVQIIRNLAGEGIPLSVHGPLNQERFWNLSRKEIGETLAAMDKNFEDFEKLGIHEVVFHGALMSDTAPEAFGHGKSYNQCMEPIYRPELARYPGKNYNRDFTAEPEFAVRYELLRMCHLHSSSYTSAIPADQWSDGHKRLTLDNPEMQLQQAFRTLACSGLEFFVLEISDADIEELQIMKQWLN